jgi:hypothetical protein
MRCRYAMSDQPYIQHPASRRESSMRAGESTACVTTDSDTEAQLHSDGIPGSYPAILDLNHNNEVKVGSWEGISVVSPFFNCTRTET